MPLSAAPARASGSAPATAVEPALEAGLEHAEQPGLALGLEPTGPGTASAELDPTWRSWAGPHGGLLGALLLHTARALVPEGQTPRGLTVQFLAPPQGTRVDLRAEVVRRGGSSTVVTGTLRGEDGEVATTATLTAGRARGTGRVARVPAPAVPAAADVAPLELPVQLVPFAQHLEFRPLGTSPLSGGDAPELTAWVRLRGGGAYDPGALTVLADAMPPALYGAVQVPVPVPTVELSVLFTSPPRCRTGC